MTSMPSSPDRQATRPPMNRRTRIKICGITRADDARAAVDAGADAIGLVFWSGTPRMVTHAQAQSIVAALPPYVSVVGLFVDPEPQAVRETLAAVPIDMLQFHGAEPAAFCRAFGRRYVKAIPVRDGVDLLESMSPYDDAAGLLFDAFREGDLPGGTGRVFDWGRLTPCERMQSPRYQEILAPLALGDELRAALMAKSVCWGFLCLHRDQSSPCFTPAEAVFLRRLTPHIALGLRKALLLGSVTRSQVPDEPGLLLLTDDLSVVSITPVAEQWLTEIAAADSTRKPPLPYAISAVVARLKAAERGVAGEASLAPKVRLRTASGRWLVLHASRLAGLHTQQLVAVIFEVARPVEIAPIIVQAYDLSRREGEILQTVLRGLSTSEMTDTFHIASHTVQDHLKAIFEKVGVRSRRELAGQLFAQQYQPRIMSGREVDTSGWFIW